MGEEFPLPPRPSPPVTSATSARPSHPARERLPDRRRLIRAPMRWSAKDRPEEFDFAVEIGVYPDGRVGEIFATGPKAGTTMRAMVNRSCMAVSGMLQTGWTLAAVVNLCCRPGERAPDSPFEAILLFALRMAAGEVDENGAPVEPGAAP